MKEKFLRIFAFYLNKKRENSVSFWISHLLLVFLIFCGFGYTAFIKAPRDFPSQQLFYLEEGSSLNQAAQKLRAEGFIKSPFWLKNAVIILRGEEKLKTGEYFFPKTNNTFEIARRIIKGEFGLTPIKVTIHEGLNIFEVAKLLDSDFPKFDSEKFLALAKNKEGYLFPDTYFFAPNTRAAGFVETMEKNFYQKIETISEELKKSGKPLDEVIKMASIIETEARTLESRKIISGILLKRLEIDMPLQVDVTFKYINGKNSFNLTAEDLQIDSPYNTYTNRGLPPTPIANPGLDSILAAIKPTDTEFLFFLADKSGKIYYAETFDQHIANKQNFLHN